MLVCRIFFVMAMEVSAATPLDPSHALTAGHERHNETHVMLNGFPFPLEAAIAEANSGKRIGVSRLLQLLRKGARPHTSHGPPRTFVGSIVLPACALLVVCAVLLRMFAPAQWRSLSSRAGIYASAAGLSARWHAAREWWRRRRWAVTRVMICSFFVHEGLKEVQVKWAQFEEASHPLLTPFGIMRMVPPWQKGDAVDLVLFFTALTTMANVLPELGLVLLLVDVITDVIDLAGESLVASLVGQAPQINELSAKKVAQHQPRPSSCHFARPTAPPVHQVALMGALMLAATHEWRERRRSAAALPDGDGRPHD